MATSGYTGSASEITPPARTLTQLAASHYAQRLVMDEELRSEPHYVTGYVDERVAASLRRAIAGSASNAELQVLVGRQVEWFRAAGNVTAEPGSDEWRTIARALCVSEWDDRHHAERFLSSLDGYPLRPVLDDATPACFALVAAILPAPDEDQAKPSSTTRTEDTGKPWAVHFSDLYRYATGWLGWTPATAWDASCDEITAAFAAHVDRLVAVNGGKREDDQDDDQAGPVNVYTPEKMREIEELGHDPAFQRDKLRALKARMG